MCRMCNICIAISIYLNEIKSHEKVSFQDTKVFLKEFKAKILKLLHSSSQSTFSSHFLSLV